MWPRKYLGARCIGGWTVAKRKVGASNPCWPIPFEVSVRAGLQEPGEHRRDDTTREAGGGGGSAVRSVQRIRSGYLRIVRRLVAVAAPAWSL
jgi:hypothetical protein